MRHHLLHSLRNYCARYLVVGVVGVGIWRATFAALARGETLHGLGRLGLGLGVGMLCGQFLSFMGEELGHQTVDLDAILWSVLVVTSLGCFFRWLAAGQQPGCQWRLPALPLARSM